MANQPLEQVLERCRPGTRRDYYQAIIDGHGRAAISRHESTGNYVVSWPFDDDHTASVDQRLWAAERMRMENL